MFCVSSNEKKFINKGKELGYITNKDFAFFCDKENLDYSDREILEDLLNSKNIEIVPNGTNFITTVSIKNLNNKRKE